MATYSIPLEFKLVEREMPTSDSTTGSTTRRGKIKEHDTPKWLSAWIPWDDHMDVTHFLRNLQRELAAVGLAATRDVERNMRARIDEYKIFNGEDTSPIPSNLLDHSSSSNSLLNRSGVGGKASKSSSSSSKRSAKRAKTFSDGYDDEEDDLDEEEEEEDDNDDDHDDEVYSGRKTSRRSASKRKSYSADRSFATTNRTSSTGQPEASEAIPRSSSSKAVRSCASCENQLDPGENVCTTCGTEVESQKAKGVLGKGKKFCKNCSAIIASSRKDCPICFAHIV